MPQNFKLQALPMYAEAVLPTKSYVRGHKCVLCTTLLSWATISAQNIFSPENISWISVIINLDGAWKINFFTKGDAGEGVVRTSVIFDLVKPTSLILSTAFPTAFTKRSARHPSFQTFQAPLGTYLSFAPTFYQCLAYFRCPIGASMHVIRILPIPIHQEKTVQDWKLYTLP